MANLICMALNCTSSTRNTEDLRFHHIPSDAKRRTEWIIACKRTDLMDKPPTFFKNMHVCDLHFLKSMYRNNKLLSFAIPSLHWTATSRDSSTQTWESIKFLGPTTDINYIPALPALKKIEVRTCHTQTEEFIICTCAKHNLENMTENEITCTQISEHNMQCDELQIKCESEIKEDEKELIKEETDEVLQISKNNEQESMNESCEMSIDEFTKLNEGLENQLREELKNKNIPQTPIEKKPNSISNCCHKGIQTDDVIIYKIPKNNKCFQQCLRCGKNASRLAPKLVKPDHLITLEDFETACERFLTPAFCATVKNQILKENQANQKKKRKMNPLHDV